MLRTFSIVVLSALVASLAWAADAVKGPAPAFALQSRDGAKVSPAQYKGDVVMINFWATWCVPCREEMPKLEALYQRLNPLRLRRELDAELDRLWALAAPAPPCQRHTVTLTYEFLRTRAAAADSPRGQAVADRPGTSRRRGEFGSSHDRLAIRLDRYMQLVFHLHL